MEISKGRIEKLKNSGRPRATEGETPLKLVEGLPHLKQRPHRPSSGGNIGPSGGDGLKMKRLYVAYGSNLNLEQMNYQCPTAKVYGKGRLYGYRLLFKGVPGNAYLTIESYQDGKVPVVIWEIEPEDELALDRYEGYPSFYYKEEMQVELETGEIVTAMVYIMTSKIKDRIYLNLPSQGYLRTVKEGYKSAGFDLGFIDEAIEISKSREL